MKRPARFIVLGIVVSIVVLTVSLIIKPPVVSPLVDGSGITVILQSPTPGK